jgi:hypothetical protein
MFLLLHLIVLIAAIQDVSSLQCYAYISGANNTMIVGIQDSTVMTGVCTNSSCACASYIFQCTTGYSLCSTQQQQNQAMIWNYTLTTNTACEGFALNGTYMNVTCCYTNLCNSQGLGVDVATVTSMNPISTTSTRTVTNMFSTTTPNSTSLLSFSIWIIFLALYFSM